MSHIRWYPLVMRNVRAAGRARKPAFIPRLTALEDRTLLATLVVNPAGGPGIYTTIQAAVTAAAAGDTIAINPATYTEQVRINTSLTMMSTAPGVIIQPPPTLTQDPLGLTALVEINNSATVDMSDLTVQGPVPNGITIDAGILVVGGATANVTNSTIAHIRNETLNNISGTGYGILVGGASGSAQVGTATITNDTITDYQKEGIRVNGGSSATITGNTIATAGPASVIAQNGILINTGATATITGNTITGNQYTGPGSGPNPITNTPGAGIIVLGSASVTGNTVTGNDWGIYNSSTGTTISGNTVQGSFEGILLDQGTATVSNNTVDGNNIGVAVIAYMGNTANSQGTLLSNNIFNNGNGGLSFPGAGISVLAQAGATTTATATAHFNRIVGNFVGFDNTTTTPADATLNWWGINTGPNTTGGDKALGNVSTSPWLVLSLAASPSLITAGGTSTVTASVTSDSSGATHLTAPFFPNGIPIFFGATGGTITPASAPTQSGSASSSFTSTSSDPSVSATLDNQTVSLTIEVSPAVVPPVPAVVPPVVESLQRFGVHTQPTTFVLTFSTALEPAPAEDVANYRLNRVFGHRLGRAIPIKAAIYDPTTDTVALHPAHRVYLFGHYRLEVNGSTPTGVARATGLLLDGKGNGQPGSDFVTTFGKSILAGPNVQISRAERSPLHRSRTDAPHPQRHG